MAKKTRTSKISAPEQGSLGTSLEEWLEEDGMLEEVDARVQKRMVADQIRKEMKRQHLSEVALARRMKTSRSQVSRILDPQNTSGTLLVLTRAAGAVGMELGLVLRRRVPEAARVVRRSR